MSSSRESVTHSSWPMFSSHGVSTSTREWSFGLFSLSLSVTPSSVQCTLHPIQAPPETQQKNLRHVQHWRGLPFGMQEEWSSQGMQQNPWSRRLLSLILIDIHDSLHSIFLFINGDSICWVRIHTIRKDIQWFRYHWRYVCKGAPVLTGSTSRTWSHKASTFLQVWDSRCPNQDPTLPSCQSFPGVPARWALFVWLLHLRRDRTRTRARCGLNSGVRS